MLGDAWGNEPQPEGGVFSVDYYRNKAREFQTVLNSLDETGQALASVEFAVSCDSNASMEWYGLMQEFQTKRDQFKLAANSINLAAGGLNAIGVNFPVLSIPQGLAALPLVPIAALAAAFAVAGSLIAWAGGFFETVGDFLRRSQTLAAIQQLPPEERAAAMAELHAAELRVTQARENATGGMFGNLATIAKWAAIAGVAFLAYKVWDGQRGN